MNDVLKQLCKNVLKKYEKKESAILEIFHLIQKEKNYIDENDVVEVSNILELPYSRIKSVLTFYTMFNQHKTAKYHIQICRNISCHMAGSKRLVRYLEEKLNIKEGEISEDGMFSFTTVECLGGCGNACVIMINETYYENMDEKKLADLIEKLRSEK